jgi:hypothetical protein
MKLTDKQQSVIDTLKKYPNDMIMHGGWMTGGHGIKLDLRTVESLRKKGIIEGGKLKKIKVLELNNITSVVNKVKTKYKEGFVASEIETLLKEYGINRAKFDESMGCVTCIVIKKEVVYYRQDIVSSIRTALGGIENVFDWD